MLRLRQHGQVATPIRLGEEVARRIRGHARNIGVDGEAAVERPPCLGRVTRTKVQQGKDVRDAVPCLEVHHHLVRQGRVVVGRQDAVLLVRERSDVGAPDDVEDVVVVERQVPLHVPRTVLDDIILVALERRAVRRVEILGAADGSGG